MENFEKSPSQEKSEIGPGDTILVTNKKNRLYNQEVEVIRKGEKGGCWVKDEDDEEVYIPFGYDKK